ncbi:semaphorin-4G-like isoform X2 [Sardina pilchardus]|uniref:semaphorin-4G-like isoform X2 n=1 Tax=Sardina pilchardus TaxID=27697 RepID=UPI002E1259C2
MIGRRGASAAGLSSRTGLAAMATHDALLLLLVLWLRCVSVWGGYPFRPPMELDVTPRTTVFASGLLGCERFQGSVVNYSTLLLEEKGERVEKAEEAGEAQGGEESEGGGGGARARGGGGEGGGGVLYVGARGAVYALQANNISASPPRTIEWEAPADQKKQCLNKGRDNKTECFNHIRFLQRFNSTHLYMCGTHAFKPLCAYIDADKFQISSGFEEGREKCPYDPAKGYTGLLIDEQMYTASQYEFRSSPDIKRNWPTPTIKTEEAPTRWLLEADFVGSALVRESVNSSVGDDDKIYFFFTEKSQEQTPFGAQGRVARVARICKGDRGGHLTLQRKWTSFLKARLTCSLHDYQLHFNVLRSVFTFNGVSAQDTLFYGIFGLEWKNVKASAICQYSIGDMWQVFEGPYMESQDTSYKWSEYTGKTPEPRPGSCITDRLRAKGMNSSFDLPDDVLHFVRRHPLMFRQVQPRLQRPLLFKRSTDYTQLAVHGQPALDGHTYHVLFIGTDEGWLHRAVEVEGRLHIIEELQLFEQAQPVDSIVISGAQRSVYVGSASEVVQLPMSTCGRYASCYDCVFSRDPFCAWDGNGEQCVEISTHSDRSNLRQDVQQGNRGCENETADVSQRSRSVMQGDDVLLQCELSSNVALPEWTLDGARLQGYGLDSGFRVGTDGLLLISVRPEQSGRYRCFALENGARVPMAAYEVAVLAERPPVHPADPAAEPTPPPEDLGGGAEDLTTERPAPHTSRPPSQNSATSAAGPQHHSLTPPPPAPPLPPRSDFLSLKNMEAMYLSLVTILGGLCLVLTVVLLYVGFCVSGRRGKYSLSRAQRLRGAAATATGALELRTVSSHCNGTCRPGRGDAHLDGLLQIVPGEGQASPNKEHHASLPPAPPLPPPPAPEAEFANGLAATLPNVLRKMNGNSYVLLRQSESESTSPLYYSFTEELSRILEKRKHTQLVSTPDESSV